MCRTINYSLLGCGQIEVTSCTIFSVEYILVFSEYILTNYIVTYIHIYIIYSYIVYILYIYIVLYI